MDKIDTKLMAHVAVEIVVIGAVTFYFHKKTRDLSDRLDALEKQNEFLRNAVESHDAYLREIFEGKQPQRHAPKRMTTPSPAPAPQRPPRPPRPQRPEESEPDFDDEDLDAELQDEFNELGSEDECDNGLCEVKR